MKNAALDVLKKTKLITIATINSDGSPRATPLLAYFEDGKIFWNSSKNAKHSENIARDSRVAISMWYEDTEASVFRAAYIATRANDTGESYHSDQYNQDLSKYEAPVGELDESTSEVDRYYFVHDGDKS